MSNKTSKKVDCHTFSEEEFGKRMDRCLTDLIVKGTTGLIAGSIVSLLFFKRKSWGMALGTGMGIGMAYRACEQQLNI